MKPSQPQMSHEEEMQQNHVKVQSTDLFESYERGQITFEEDLERLS